MKFNKGMLSSLRQEKQKKSEDKNIAEKFTSLMNTYHSIDLTARLTDLEKIAAKKEIEYELKMMKARLPTSLAVNMFVWLKSRNEWLMR
ncbi:hypothetical protein [Alishewanella phage vB_AspM_Slickus01]|nr:hypothetical protein [Alishewanella phage vB_AspM_Slickus01]